MLSFLYFLYLKSNVGKFLGYFYIIGDINVKTTKNKKMFLKSLKDISESG